MEASMKMAVFWVVALCSLVKTDRRFRGRPTCCLHHQGDDHGGSKYLWNVGKLLPDYTELQPRRQTSRLMMFENTYYYDQIKEDEMGVACTTHMRNEKCIQNHRTGCRKWSVPLSLSDRSSPPPNGFCWTGNWMDASARNRTLIIILLPE
jgi:hypothetical protein